MPWNIEKNDKGEYCLYKKSDGSLVKGSCHSSRPQTAKMMAAMYASEGIKMTSFYSETIQLGGPGSGRKGHFTRAFKKAGSHAKSFGHGFAEGIGNFTGKGLTKAPPKTNSRVRKAGRLAGYATLPTVVVGGALLAGRSLRKRQSKHYRDKVFGPKLYDAMKKKGIKGLEVVLLDDYDEIRDFLDQYIEEGQEDEFLFINSDKYDFDLPIEEGYYKINQPMAEDMLAELHDFILENGGITLSLTMKNPVWLGCAVTNRPHIRLKEHPLSVVEVDGKKYIRVPMMKAGKYRHPQGDLDMTGNVLDQFIQNHTKGLADFEVVLDAKHQPDRGALGLFESKSGAFVQREKAGTPQIADPNGELLVAYAIPTGADAVETIESGKFRHASMVLSPSPMGWPSMSASARLRVTAVKP